MQERVRIGADVGGTFTDLVLARPDGRLFVAKVTTTPDDPGRGITAGLSALLAEAGVDPASVAEIVHGTTVASNTILQKTGARTGLLTTRGFRDVLEIGRIRTPVMFDLSWRKPEPLVPRRWRLEVPERIAADGSVVTPLDEAAVRAAARFFCREGVEAVAICFIHAYANPTHERRAAALLREEAPELLVTASCEVLPEIGEYERTSTAAVNAYVLPAMRGYLSRLTDRLAGIGLRAPIRVMASNAGLIGLASARERPVFAVGSGPAGGVAGAAELCRTIGVEDLVAFDMGGTTAKASVIERGMPALVSEYEFRDGISSPSRFIKGAGYMLKVPAVDIAEVGSGGGSIARVDSGGLLLVGPESAGGDPGPACYGRGTVEPTLTDANMVLGHLNPRALAGGTLPVDPDLARRAVARLASRLGLSLEATAFGIRRLANASMARAIRAVTVERGKDPRDLALLAFGGGGPLHAVDVARLLGIRRVLVPPAAGVFSAVGMLAAEAAHEAVEPILSPLEAAGPLIAAARRRLEQVGRAALAEEGFEGRAVELRFTAELRYLGQSATLAVPIGDGSWDLAALRCAFDRAYRATFGYAIEEDVVELVNLRLSAIGRGTGRLTFAQLRLDPRALAGERGERPVLFDPESGFVPTRILPRAAILDGPVAGPAILESYDTTIVLPPGSVACAAPGGCVAIETEHGRD